YSSVTGVQTCALPICVFPFQKVLNPHVLIAICGISLFLIMALVIPGYGYFLVYEHHAPAKTYVVLSVVGAEILATVALTAGTTRSEERRVGKECVAR